MVDLSIIIPAYNEQKNVILLYKTLKDVLNSLKKSYEIIYIDDGSTDNTFNELKELHQKDKKVKVIKFTQNFKKAAALSAGFEHARGNIVITIDADLQDDPKEIPRFLDKLNEGYDLVVGWKYPRLDPITKTFPSKIFNFLVRKLTKTNIHDMNCNFRAIKHEVLPKLNLYNGLYRYIPILVFCQGYKITEIKVKHHPRKFGKSKYGFTRIFRGFFDLIILKVLLIRLKRGINQQKYNIYKIKEILE